jgi:hypothetical protein
MGVQHEEIEPALVTSVRPILWGDHGVDSGVVEANEIDDRQRALVQKIRGDHRADLELVVAAILSQRVKRHVVPLFVAGNGYLDTQSNNSRVLSAMPGSGQWILEQVTSWADPAASANLQVNLTLSDGIPIPVPLTLSKTGAATIAVELPIPDNARVSWATSGGAVTDRGVVLLVFKREG